MSNYILGGGIAGLIAGFYEKDYYIIGQDIGGQMSQKGLGPRILEVNDYSAKLLEDLEYDSVPIKVAKIGYRHNNRFQDRLNEQLRKKYYLKSRNIQTPNVEMPSSIMSDGKNSIRYFDIDWNDLILRLYNAVKDRYIIDKITGIDINNKLINTDVSQYDYDKIISTLPAPVFFNLSGEIPEEELTYEKKLFVIVSSKTVDLSEFDYVYYPDMDCSYHRVTRLSETRAAIEYTGNQFNHTNLFDYWRHIAFEVKTLPMGQIKSGKVGSFKDIEFLGRYAEWNHDIKTDDIVKKYVERDGLNDEQQGPVRRYLEDAAEVQRKVL